MYLNLLSAELFDGTIEAFTYPDAFGQCDGTAEPTPGVSVGQQTRKTFGFSWRTLIGNDLVSVDYGYKLHLVYNALAAPSEKANSTINDSPEAVALSWEFSTTPTDIGSGYKKSAHLVINSTKVDPTKLAALEAILYGTVGVEPRLPAPPEVLTILETTLTVVTPTKPTNAGNVITIPAITGVQYRIDGVDKAAGAQPAITHDVIVSVVPKTGYKFPPVTDVDWLFTFA